MAQRGLGPKGRVGDLTFRFEFWEPELIVTISAHHFLCIKAQGGFDITQQCRIYVLMKKLHVKPCPKLALRGAFVHKKIACCRLSVDLGKNCAARARLEPARRALGPSDRPIGTGQNQNPPEH